MAHQQELSEGAASVRFLPFIFGASRVCWWLKLCILCPFQVKMMLWFLCLSFFHWDDCFFFLMQPCCGWFDSQWSFIKADLIYILRALTYMFLYKMPWRSVHWLNKLVKAHFPVLDSLVEDWDSLHGMWFAASKVLYWP